MSDDSEDRKLQERIAKLAGQINRHKQEQQGFQPSRPATNFPNTPYAYHRGRGRGGRYAAAPAHRHRTLVLNNNSTGASSDGTSDTASELPGSPGGPAAWVLKRDGRTNQLINKSVYSQLSQQRTLDMEETHRQRQRRRNEREKAKLNSFILSSAENGTATVKDSIVNVDQARFRIVNGGNKLVRLEDEPGTAKSTPKTFRIAGVPFVRSKHGNLYRAGFAKANKSVQLNRFRSSLTSSRKIRIKKIEEPCPRFTLTGSCVKGRDCRYIHDPTKVAICREYVQKGTCILGDACDMSHDPTPNRVPQCLHFIRGNCTNENCRYAHIRVNPAAPVCRAFATIGYCEKGTTCTERHVYECPDYADTGTCGNKKCRLPHVDRAGRLRRAAASNTGQSTPADDDGSSDLSSEENYDEIDSDDIDSDDLSDDVIMAGTDGPVDHTLSQQEDFVQL